MTSAASREGPTSPDGEGGTSSTPPLKPEDGMRSRVRNARSLALSGPRSTAQDRLTPLHNHPAGLAGVLLVILLNWNGGEGERRLVLHEFGDTHEDAIARLRAACTGREGRSEGVDHRSHLIADMIRLAWAER